MPWFFTVPYIGIIFTMVNITTTRDFLEIGGHNELTNSTNKDCSILFYKLL